MYGIIADYHIIILRLVDSLDDDIHLRDGILKGLNGFRLAALLPLFYKTKAFIAHFI